jgi:hypothetical protein
MSLVLVVLGCSTDDGDVIVNDQGSLCVLHVDNASQNPFGCGELTFPADEPLVFSVDFGICMSSSCDLAIKASCQAVRDGSIIQVTAEGSYRHEGDECTDDCIRLVARCETEALPAGDYEIHYAGESMAWSLPTTRAKRCMSQEFPNCCDVSADCSEGTCNPATFHCEVPE